MHIELVRQRATSRTQTLQGPSAAVTFSGKEQAVVQPARSRMPEFNRRRYQAVAAPKRGLRDGHRLVAMLCLQLRELALQSLQTHVFINLPIRAAGLSLRKLTVQMDTEH